MMMFTVDTILPLLNERITKQGDDFLIHVLVKTLLKVFFKFISFKFYKLFIFILEISKAHTPWHMEFS